MTDNFFIAGGTGFIGRHLVKAVAESGGRARCLVRSAGKRDVCEKAGFEAVIGDITDRESLAGALDGCDVVVHLVGILEEKGDMTFEKVHVAGTANLVEEAKRAKVKHFFYQSALGASGSSWSGYFSTKAKAEELVKTSGIPYTIFRPSLVIGEGDGFTAKLKDLIRLGPFVPVPGSGSARLQPVYVGDWVKCFLTKGVKGGLYEFGGPEHLSYNEILSLLMEAMGVNKPLVHVPVGFIRLGLPFAGPFRGIGKLLGREIPSVSSEQLGLLQMDNVCDIKSVEKNFGFIPITYKEALKLFMAQ